MKKMLALVLALMMVMTMGATVFADTVNSNGGTSTGNVQIVVNGSSTTDVFAVTISWDSLQFEYTFKEWNETTLKYDGEWDKTSATVTVNNSSNVAVTVTLGAPVDSIDDGVTIALADNATAFDLDIGANGSFDVKVSGAPKVNQTQQAYTGATITVTIEKKG